MRVSFTVIAMSCLLVGCGSKQTWPRDASALKKIQSGYDAALSDATNSIPYAADFGRLFPGAARFFSYYNGGAGPSSLNMHVYLFERYELAMKVPVTFNEERRKVKSFGEPEFQLMELSEVGRASNGNLSISYNPAGLRRFGASEWKRIVAAGGNLGAIGYAVITNSPVPRFVELRKYEEMHMREQP